jgi:hypothetical protein
VDLAWGELHERVPSAEWREAVVSFADLVRAFDDASPPRRRTRASDADAMENDGWDASSRPVAPDGFGRPAFRRCGPPGTLLPDRR